MPVQTRKRNPKPAAASSSKADSDEDIEMTEAAAPATTTAKQQQPKAKRAAEPKKKAAAPAKKQKTAASPAKAKAADKGKKNGDGAAVEEEYKETFEGVVGEIDKFGSIIKSEFLTKHVPTLSKRQDPAKQAKRKTIAAELKKVSSHLLIEDQIPPTKVKQTTVQKQSRRTEAAKQFHKKVVEQIDEMGPEKVKDVLVASPVKKLPKQRATGAKGKKAVVRRKVAAIDTKKAQKKTLVELSDLVSPHVAHRPSLVKKKVQLHKAKKQVNAEVLKKASVKQIVSLSSKEKSGVLSVLKPSPAKAAVPAKTKAAGKR